MKKPYIYDEQERELIINCPASFRFSANLDYLNRSDNECMYTIRENSVERAVYADGRWVIIRITSMNDQDLIIQFMQEDRLITKAECDDVFAYVAEWFDLFSEIEPFYQLAEADPLLRDPVARFYGLRIMGISNLFEALVWGVLGQQINLTFAYTLKRRFVETFGEKIEVGGTAYWQFPTAQSVSTLDVRDLANLKMTTKKAEYIIGIAQLLASEQLTKQQLMAVETMAEAEQTLTKVRGIGPWTANYVLMRCLRYKEAFPIDDVGFQNAVKLVGGYDGKPNKQTLRMLARPWKGYEAYAVFYLWRCLY
ncbi:DNA-3-methyladenine glycosylase II [Alkalihalobacillus xiaoxiensis]|uniref:DNA-3-methyladenine glycosylase II n=1 Tax=Shouchella xiaoxiensis TaxID=766895 RepID=A0ABS2SWA2_9BACI|nr:DNA-3-methyladenine glycosylase II [Shouchella xiaoxiensis]